LGWEERVIGEGKEGKAPFFNFHRGNFFGEKGGFGKKGFWGHFRGKISCVKTIF